LGACPVAFDPGAARTRKVRRRLGGMPGRVRSRREPRNQSLLRSAPQRPALLAIVGQQPPCLQNAWNRSSIKQDYSSGARSHACGTFPSSIVVPERSQPTGSCAAHDISAYASTSQPAGLRRALVPAERLLCRRGARTAMNPRGRRGVFPGRRFAPILRDRLSGGAPGSRRHRGVACSSLIARLSRRGPDGPIRAPHARELGADRRAAATEHAVDLGGCAAECRAGLPATPGSLCQS
jgi:hypothetical protein